MKQSSSRRREQRRASKVYACAAESCGKVYSRAEHLARHQLNHNPTKVYNCDVPNCDCSFVRSDLYNRHRNRHMSEYLQQGGIQSPSACGNDDRLSDCTNFTESTEEKNLQHPTTNWQLPPHEEITTCVRDEGRKSIPPPQQPPWGPDEFPVCEISNQMQTTLQQPMNQQNQNVHIVEQQRPLDIGVWSGDLLPPVSMPFFGSEDYYRSPLTIPDEFIQFLFNGTQFSTPKPDESSITTNILGTQAQGQWNTDIFNELSLPQMAPVMDLTSNEKLLNPMELSEEKTQEVRALMINRLCGNKHAPESNLQNSLLDKCQDPSLDMMSRTRMQGYIDNYWKIFHPRLPILHQPSFSPNTAPNLLLVAIMIIGASYPSSDDPSMADARSEFSNVLAWYLRWEVFSSMHWHSEELWVFQALLLLETYEKIYSSRALHERAHVHHATTITLMRRGSFLSAKSPLHSPPSYEYNDPSDERVVRSLAERWWDEWIAREAARRVAFAAFMMDSVHAALFGHSMTMTSYEMRLVLPCDDALWSAASVKEVQKIETTLRSYGVRPIPFLEGLQKILNGQEISTNSFGRSILLCGLLSVGWHMKQREVQISSLDISSLGVRKDNKWMESIAKAFDLWKVSCGPNSRGNPGNRPTWFGDGDAAFETVSTFYHLAQFSTHVDIVDCQIFAGATRILGRVVGSQEISSVRHRIRNVWAPTVGARKATFHALRCLIAAFQEMMENDKFNHSDFLSNFAKQNTPVQRWVLYSAALIVWCYSYAVDGPLHTNISTSSTFDGHIHDMKQFLTRAENIKSPEDVAFYRLNGTAGLLNVMCYIFRKDSWELLQEGAQLLTNCIKLIDKGR
ncbi:hypothetical protein VTL71DRAFT_148 [Oculimacula yallundae]|uniref:C2H2-type domain-containing protein n=1 Tax=Oculimacula yallundae TaxID=86028 RepID=A0ABR4CZC4_9HELO